MRPVICFLMYPLDLGRRDLPEQSKQAVFERATLDHDTLISARRRLITPSAGTFIARDTPSAIPRIDSLLACPDRFLAALALQTDLFIARVLRALGGLRVRILVWRSLIHALIGRRGPSCTFLRYGRRPAARLNVRPLLLAAGFAVHIVRQQPRVGPDGDLAGTRIHRCQETRGADHQGHTANGERADPRLPMFARRERTIE